VFSDLNAFANTVRELSLASAEARAQFEADLPGFHSLRTTAGTSEGLEIPLVMQSILNGEGAYQIGQSIFVQQGSMEYRFLDEDEWLLGTIRSGESLAPYLASGNLVAHPVERVLADSSSQRRADSDASGSENTASTSQPLLDAKYQSQFGAGGHTYKFVDEAYVDRYTTYLSVCFRAKLEYRNGSSWSAAGEMVEKSISAGTINGYFASWWASPPVDRPINAYANSSQNLATCVLFTPPPSQCVSGLTLSAHFISTVTHPGAAHGYSYETQADWNTEFAQLEYCRR